MPTGKPAISRLGDAIEFLEIMIESLPIDLDYLSPKLLLKFWFHLSGEAVGLSRAFRASNLSLLFETGTTRSTSLCQNRRRPARSRPTNSPEK